MGRELTINLYLTIFSRETERIVESRYDCIFIRIVVEVYRSGECGCICIFRADV